MKEDFAMQKLENRTTVFMRLPEGVNVLEKNLYRNFKRRAMQHASFMYRDEGKKPPLFRVHKKGSLFDSTFTVLVVRNSFEIIYDSFGESEIGFSLVFRHSNGAYNRLTVMKTHKAYYEPCGKPEL
ncbi:hypothetical protein HOF65_00565 [bacterium]|jgi:hypothetical protein|nr:hypothetical protein [bacterium]MBT3852538.1 hypothetical protein [bacterium]MBT4632703.1 hypothetical protein [bacterium]MBT6778277.1 hypothetical protein [bacterium]